MYLAVFFLDVLLIFALKYKLWELVRTASQSGFNRLTEAVLTCTHDQCFEQK